MNALANARRDRVNVDKAVIELVCGDCVPILDSLQAKCVDCTVTSPPYNLGIGYEVYDDSIPREEYLSWTGRWLRAVRRVTTDQGSLFLNMGGKPKDPLGPEQVLMKAVEEGWVLQNKIYWVKSISVRVKTKEELIRQVCAKAGYTDTAANVIVRCFREIEGENGKERSFGHFKPLNSDRFVNDTVELVYHLTRDGHVDLDKLAVGVQYEDLSNLTRDNRGKNGNVRCRGNSWWIPYETIKNRDEDRPHPATYPIELAERCFKLHGLSRIQATLDPFSGLGNTALAAARLGLNHVGIELGPKTHREALRRVQEESLS